MKLKKDFIVHKAGKETMLVATGSADFSGLIKGNSMLGEVLELMKKDTTEADIVRALSEKYDAPDGKIEADVQRVVDELRKVGAVEG